MQNVSKELRKMLKGNLKPLIKIKCGNFIFGIDDETDPENPIDCRDLMDLTITRLTSQDDYPLGSSCASCADIKLWNVPKSSKLKGLKTEVYLGYLHSGYIEWIPMGVYYPEKPTRSGQVLSFSAFDKMYDLSYPYAAGISGNQTPLAILQDLARFGGFELDESVKDIATRDWGTIPVSLLYGTETDENGKSIVTAYDVNDCIGYVAGFLGANAQFNSAGKLQLFRFNEVTNADGTPYTITDNHVKNVVIEDDDHMISYIYCNNGTQELCVPEGTVMITSTGIKINNPLITTQKQLERVYNVISDADKPFTYRSLSLRYLSADPTLQCYDIVRYQDREGNTYRFPVMSTNFVYDGSFVCDMQSFAKSVVEGYSSGAVLNKMLTPVLQTKAKPLASRIEKATQVITGNSGGYVSLVDTDGDNVPDNFVAGEYPVDLSVGSNWRTKGNCVRINKKGIAVSTTGADGPFRDFAVYYDENEGKYLVNASDIATGILHGIEILAEKGKIGAFNIDDGTTTVKGGLFADYVGSKTSYRVFIQPAYYDSKQGTAANTWAFSTQKASVDNGTVGSYSGTFIVYADGSVEHNEPVYMNDIVYLADGQSIRHGSKEKSSSLISYTNSGNIAIGSAAGSNGNVNLYTDNAVNISVDGTKRLYFDYAGWKIPNVDTETTYRPTFSSTGGLVLNANDGQSALYLHGSSIRNLGDVYLTLRASSGTVALVVNSRGKITATSSSERYKENITDELSEELNPEKLYELPVVQYNYRNECKDIELVAGTQIGILAEDVEKYYPNALIRNAKGQAESWQDRIMIPAMLKLIQDQKKQLDEQKKQIDDLVKRVEKLEK